MIHQTRKFATFGISIYLLLPLAFFSLLFSISIPFYSSVNDTLFSFKIFLLMIGGVLGIVGLLISILFKSGAGWKTNILLLFGIYSFLFFSVNGPIKIINFYFVPIVILLAVDNFINNTRGYLKLHFLHKLPLWLVFFIHTLLYFLSYLYMFDGYLAGLYLDSVIFNSETDKNRLILVSYMLSVVWIFLLIFSFIKKSSNLKKWSAAIAVPITAFIFSLIKSIY